MALAARGLTIRRYLVAAIVVALLTFMFLLFVAPTPAHRYHWYSGSATAYATCDGSTSLQANGTRIHYGEVANNFLPLGAWVEVTRPRSALRLLGRRYFRVEDRGGPGFMVDFVARSCGWMTTWGRRRVSMRVVPAHHLWNPLPGRRLRPDHGYYWRCCWRFPRWSPT